MVSSSRSRCALTRAGGVSASHCTQHVVLVSGYVRRRVKPRAAHLTETDVLEAVRVKDLEEAERGVARVLDIVSEGGRHEADVSRLQAE